MASRSYRNSFINSTGTGTVYSVDLWDTTSVQEPNIRVSFTICILDSEPAR